MATTREQLHAMIHELPAEQFDAAPQALRELSIPEDDEPVTDEEMESIRESREELLELVRRQQAELSTREAAIEQRDEKIRELEEELAQFRRPAKTPESSSVPPARGQKANRGEGRRRKLGPEHGHVGVSRVRSESDMVVDRRPRACAGCGQGLPPTGGAGRDVARSSSCRHSSRW